MTWSEKRWVRNHLKRLDALGAPDSVINRWLIWLAASDLLPSTEMGLADLLCTLDDPCAAIPGPLRYN